MPAKRVHIQTVVNAANVRRTKAGFLIANVCGAVDDIVMNGVLYPAAELAKAAPTLNDRPAPIGHPKNEAGQYISANSGDALLSSYAGVICRGPRHEAGRTVTDLEANKSQLAAHPEGSKVVDWCNAAADGKNPDPMHVSTGLVANMIEQAGTSGGKAYTRVATDIRYDHLALLPDGGGAGRPEQGVGMFNDGSDNLQEVETIVVNADPQDRRGEGFIGWLRGLFGNTDISFDQITSGLYATLADGAWLQEVFDRYAIWRDRDGALWRQDYAVASDGSVAWSGTATEVTRKVSYEPITNREERDAMKDFILNALRAAGVAVDGKADDQLMRDYDALKAKPLQDQITAANSKVAEFEAAERAAADAELTALATELATNSTLRPEDFKAMGLARCKELKAKAEPVIAGNRGVGQHANPFANYDPNQFLQPAKEGA